MYITLTYFARKVNVQQLCLVYLLEYFYMALFCSFFPLLQILLVIIIVTPKPFYFHWLTTQNGHLLNCLRQGKTIILGVPYVVTQDWDRHSEADMTFAFTTTHDPIAIRTATLAIRTVHRAVTATAAHSPKHSWQELTGSQLTKQKLFTKQHEHSKRHSSWTGCFASEELKIHN